jgi:hypothetical protein
MQFQFLEGGTWLATGGLNQNFDVSSALGNPGAWPLVVADGFPGLSTYNQNASSPGWTTFVSYPGQSVGRVVGGNQIYYTQCGDYGYACYNSTPACAGMAPPTELYSNGMIGCAGATSFAQAQTLCAPEFHVCSASEWNMNRGNVAPAYDYWTSSNLHFYGSAGSCEVVDTGFNTCTPSTDPMRVCTLNDGGTDPFANTCNWTGCGYETTSNEYFGGCSYNDTAGALCCPGPTAGCASGYPTDVFMNGMVGCGGNVLFNNRATLCESGYHVCSAAEWTANSGTGVPTNNYWTSQQLNWSGAEGTGNFDALTSGGNGCGGSYSMLICKMGDNSSDNFGNGCTWTGGGLGAGNTQNEYFGGCASTAGALCCP